MFIQINKVPFVDNSSVGKSKLVLIKDRLETIILAIITQKIMIYTILKSVENSTKNMNLVLSQNTKASTESQKKTMMMMDYSAGIR